MKTFNIVKSILYYLIIGFLLIIIALSIFIPNGMIKTMGFGWYRVVSPSMTGLIEVDDYIVAVKTTDPTQLKNGDIIVFETVWWHEGAYKRDVVTHHFLKYDEAADRIYTYRHDQYGKDEDEILYDTQWASAANTPYYVKASDLLGVHVLTLPTHHIIPFLSSPFGIITIIINIGLIVGIVYVFKGMKADKTKTASESVADENETKEIENEENIDDMGEPPAK